MVQVYDGMNPSQAIRLHPGTGFSLLNKPTITLSADSGAMFIKFNSDPLRSERGWSATFSAGELKNYKNIAIVLII